MVFLPAEQLCNPQAAVFHNLAAIFGTAGIHIIVVAAQHQGQERHQEPQIQQHRQHSSLQPCEEHCLAERPAEPHQAEHGCCQNCHLQGQQMHLQQHSKGRNKFCAGPAQPLAGKRTFPIQFIQGSRNQRQKRHGCVLPHRAEPVNLIQMIGRQHIQDAAHQGRLVMPENLPQAEKGNASCQQLECQQIGMIRPLHTHPQ